MEEVVFGDFAFTEQIGEDEGQDGGAVLKVAVNPKALLTESVSHVPE